MRHRLALLVDPQPLPLVLELGLERLLERKDGAAARLRPLVHVANDGSRGAGGVPTGAGVGRETERVEGVVLLLECEIGRGVVDARVADEAALRFDAGGAQLLGLEGGSGDGCPHRLVLGVRVHHLLPVLFVLLDGIKLGQLPCRRRVLDNCGRGVDHDGGGHGGRLRVGVRILCVRRGEQPQRARARHRRCGVQESSKGSLAGDAIDRGGLRFFLVYVLTMQLPVYTWTGQLYAN